MVHTASFVSVLRRAFGKADGAMMSCQDGHVMPYQRSDFHKKEEWQDNGITAPFANAGYEIVRFNHVTSHPDAAACCVGERHALGGVHIVTHPSWGEPRSYCVRSDRRSVLAAGKWAPESHALQWRARHLLLAADPREGPN
jgi:hypothetical protein